MDNPNLTFRPMRRFKQQATEEECRAILQSAQRGFLAVHGEGGYPYALPINFAYHEDKVWFHCAMEGHKLDAIRTHDKVCFTVLNDGFRNEGEWWNNFTSVICFGRLRVVDDDQLKDKMLRVIGNKYFPEGYDIEHDIEKNAPSALILEMSIEHMTGKKVREK